MSRQRHTVENHSVKQWILLNGWETEDWEEGQERDESNNKLNAPAKERRQIL